MSASPHRNDDLAKLRSDLAAMAVEVGFIRVERVLSRRFSADQPREPAGQPGGGRWASGSSGGDSGSRATEEVVTDDGSRVLSLRIRSHPSQDWDEQHTVTAPDGTRTVFEMAGRTQTIRDGDTGAILARSTLTGARAEPEAFIQNVRNRSPLRDGIARAVEAAGTLFAALSGRNGSDRKAIFIAPASEYAPGLDANSPAIWVGRVDQAGLDAACPRNGEVQAILDAAAASVRASGNFMGPQDFGNKAHAISAGSIRSLHDPNFVAEDSYFPNNDESAKYGARGSLRLDVLERSVLFTVCIYDHKTGQSGLSPRRASDFSRIVRRHFPETRRIIIMEMRPQS